MTDKELITEPRDHNLTGSTDKTVGRQSDLFIRADTKVKYPEGFTQFIISPVYMVSRIFFSPKWVKRN